jgi:hypothetical protein
VGPGRDSEREREREERGGGGPGGGFFKLFVFNDTTVTISK